MAKAHKKKRGRPPKANGVGKTVLMQVRLSPAEKEIFSDTAELVGEQLSVWVRLWLRRAVQEEMKVRDKPDPFLSLRNETGRA